MEKHPLEFVSLTSAKQIRSRELRRRAKTFPGRSIDIRYLVRRGGKEIGLLWYMVFPHDKFLKVHEMYLLKQYRGRGIGPHLIKHAEQLATDHACHGLTLSAVPLDRRIHIGRLCAWYEKQGFVESDRERHIFNRFLAQAPLTTRPEESTLEKPQ